MNRRALMRVTASSLAVATAAFAGSSALAQSATPPGPATSGDQFSPGSTGAAASQSTTAPGPTASPTPGNSNVSSGYTVDTVVVTAQKRKENLQDVPIVVTVVNRQLLQDSGVRDIKDLSKLTSGLTVTSTASEASTTARIRGVGTVGDNPGLEPSVGVVIDGVYRPRNGVGFNDLGDVDQIEVLKGPQGTLFGKSTSAGVINITTAEPTFKTGGSAEFTAGNYNEVGGSAEVHGALPILGGDKVAASLYFADRHRDGFYDVNTGQGPRTDGASDNEDFYTIRGQLLFRPDSNFTGRLILDYTHRDETCCAAVVKSNSLPLSPSPLNVQAIVAALGGAGGGEAQTPDPYNRVASQNRPSTQNIIDEGVSYQADYKIPSINAAITSITAFRNWKLLDGNDLDFSNADLFFTPSTDANSTQFQDFSQELRFAGTYGKLDYLVGGFYANEYLRDNFEFEVGNQFNTYLSELFSGGADPNFLADTFGPNANFPGGSASMDRYRQRDDDYALFTNDTYHFTSKFDINVGVRYTIDNKVLNSSNQNVGGNTGQGCSTIDGSLPVQLGLIPQALLNTVCLPFFSPAFNNFQNHQSESTSNTSGTVKAVYRWSPQLLTYVSYAKGFKAGGFNLDRTGCPNGLTVAQGGPCPVYTVPTVPTTQFLGTAGEQLVTAITANTNTFFKPEYSDSIEAGAKTTLFDRKLLLNGSLFYEKFSNFQYNTFNGLVFVVDSLPAVYSKGLDTDFLWRPIRDLNVQGGLTIASTRFSHSDGDAASGILASSGFLGAAGSRLPLAPQYSASLEGTYTYRLPADYMVRFNLGTKFNSRYNTGSDEDPRKEQTGYFVTDGRIIFGPSSGRYDIELWGENLFDTNYEQVAFDSGFQNAPTNATGLIDAFLGNPRTFGATLRAKF